MMTNGRLVSLVKKFEGCKLVAYQDVRGIWTIGYGHTKGVYEGQTCTQEQAEAWLLDDLLEATHELFQVSPGPFVPGALDALTSFVFNLGIGNYRSSTLRKYVDAQDWESVKTELLRWNHSGGQVIAGLLARREAEAALIGELA
jgi:lysozyme